MFEVAIWGTVGQWVGAIGTSCAVIVALFKDEVTKRWRRPKLFVTAELRPPHCHMTTLGPYQVQRTALTTVVTACYYLRLWIENNGRSRADRVQVFVARVQRKIADGTFSDVSSFLPMNLRWSHGLPDGGVEIYADGISPKMGKHCDLARIIDPVNRKDFGEDIPGLSAESTVLALELEVRPNTGAHLLRPGQYRIEIHLAAANCVPSINTIEMTVTGKWSKDEGWMFREGIGMRVV